MRVVHVRSSSRRWPSALTSVDRGRCAHDRLLAVDPSAPRGRRARAGGRSRRAGRGPRSAAPTLRSPQVATRPPPKPRSQSSSRRRPPSGPRSPTAETQASGTPRYQAPKQSRPRSGSSRTSIPSHTRRSSARHPPSVRDAVAEQTASRFASAFDHAAVRTIGSPLVTTIVCSSWAELAPLAVTTVQPSPVPSTLRVPVAIIGSMVTTRPSCSRARASS